MNNSKYSHDKAASGTKTVLPAAFLMRLTICHFRRDRNDSHLLILCDLSLVLQIFFDMECIFLIIIGEFFITRVLCNVKLIREERTHTTDLQDSFATVHDGELILTHQFLAGFLIVETVAAVGATGIAGVIKVDGFLAQDCTHFL